MKLLGITLRILLLLALFNLPTVSYGQPKSGLHQPSSVDPAEAEKNGRALVSDLLAETPAPNTTAGLLTVREADRKPRSIPVRFEINVAPTNWTSTYEAASADGMPETKLVVAHFGTGPNEYYLTEAVLGGSTNAQPRKLVGNESMIPFVGSDFWVGDLGLEFLHWPKQLLLRKEMRRSRSCNVVESINPQPAPGAYSRVLCWIDSESGGIVHADAYDSENALLKQFDPKEFKKIQGQWQLEGMEIRNRQTGSRTRIEFKLDR